MESTHYMSAEEIKNYLKSQDISYKEAQKIAKQLKQQYPHLGHAVRDSKDIRADLELIELVYHVQRGRFPVKQKR